MKKIPRLFLLRVFGIVAFAALVLAVSNLGDIRFWIAGVILFVLLPAAAAIEFRFPDSQTRWMAPLPELLATLILVQLAPEYWHTAMCLALMLALAPSIHDATRPEFVHALMGTIVVIGMGATGWWHDVPRWELTTLTVMVVYPAIIAYAATLSRKRGAEKSQAQALRSLNLIAGSVAHRFSNATMAITGNLELSLRALPTDHPVRKYLENALKGAEVAGHTSKQLATFAGGTLDSDRQVRIASELDILVGLMKLILPDEVTLEYDMPTSVPMVSGNRFQLQHLVMSAIQRIAEKMTRPGCIVVSCIAEAKIVVEIRDQSISQVDYRQLDSGSLGFQSQDLDENLEPFDRQDGTIQVAVDNGRLVALRMLLVGELQESASAELAEASPKPAEVVTQQAPEVEPAEDPVEDPHLRVLVVDDEEAVRNTMVAILTHLDCDPTPAGGGAEAIELLKSDRDAFDHVFLDLKMPGMDGWETLAGIREINPRLSVTIASGYDPRPEWERPDVHVSYLQKPFTIASVRQVIE